MIAKSIILFLALIILPQLWIDWQLLRRRGKLRRLLCWLPTIIILGYTIYLATLPNWVPDNYLWLEVWYWMIGIVVIPQAIFVLCSLIGMPLRKNRHIPSFLHSFIPSFLGLIAAVSFLYGLYVGFEKLEVRHVTMTCEGLPEAFDGYRVVHISDAHVGTFQGFREWMLSRAVDSINAQHPELILFTGDLQNFSPRDVVPHLETLRRMKATDGIISILGNHDYGKYADVSLEEKKAIEREIVAQESRLGWTVLRNSSQVVKRDNDSIVIAGEEFDTEQDDPYKEDIHRLAQKIDPRSFLIMLEHNPDAWEDRVLPNTNARIQLSGHTHGGQVAIFGIRVTQLTYKHDYGLEERDGRYLYTTSGLGGVVPLRIGVPAEIVVITLKKS